MFNLRIITGSFKARAGSRFHYFLKCLVLFVSMGFFLYSCADMENTVRKYLDQIEVEEESEEVMEGKYTIEEWLDDNRFWYAELSGLPHVGKHQLGKRYMSNYEHEVGRSVVLDSSGQNIYVGGHSTSPVFEGFTISNAATKMDDAFIFKYDSNGTKQWTRRVWSSEFEDKVFSLATDSSGNVIAALLVEGQIVSGESTGHLAVVKYDSSGTKLWANKRAESTDGFVDSVSGYTRWDLQLVERNVADVATDSSDNILLVSKKGTGGTDEIQIIKYNSSGEILWENSAVVASYATAIRVVTDSGDNAYVLAQYPNGTADNDTGVILFDDCIRNVDCNSKLLKFNSSGTQLFAKDLVEDTVLTDLIIDSNGDLYATGFKKLGYAKITRREEYRGGILIKINSSGSKLWEVTIREPGKLQTLQSVDSGWHVFALGVTTGNGNVFVVGKTEGALAGYHASNDINTHGGWKKDGVFRAPAWWKHYFTSVGISDMFVTKFDSSGTRSW